jgi:hypothetical protein
MASGCLRGLCILPPDLPLPESAIPAVSQMSSGPEVAISAAAMSLLGMWLTHLLIRVTRPHLTWPLGREEQSSHCGCPKRRTPAQPSPQARVMPVEDYSICSCLTQSQQSCGTLVEPWDLGSHSLALLYLGWRHALNTDLGTDHWTGRRLWPGSDPSPCLPAPILACASPLPAIPMALSLGGPNRVAKPRHPQENLGGSHGREPYQHCAHRTLDPPRQADG